MNQTVAHRPSALHFALRELRGFAVFIACIALGVMAVVGIGQPDRRLRFFARAPQARTELFTQYAWRGSRISNGFYLVLALKPSLLQ